MKRLIMLVLVLASVMITGCKTTESGIPFSEGGKFSGSAEDYAGGIIVELDVKNGAIIEIEASGVNEGFPLAVDARDEIIEGIVSNQSLPADVIAGATITSKALAMAVEEAIIAAGMEPAYFKSENAGAKIEDGRQEQVYDIVVVGGGAAGLAASVEASLQGKRVVLIEKLPFVGGNTALSGGEMSVPGSDLQKKFGIDDDVKTMIEDIFIGGREVGDLELIRVFCDNINSTFQWLQETVGVKVQDRVYMVSGHTVPRTVIPIGLGAGVVDRLLALAESNGVQVVYNAKATDLIVDEAGQVSGVYAIEDSHKHPIFAREKTILATGGFSANVEMREFYNNHWASLGGEVLTSNSPGITGDGILMAEQVGAKLIDMEFIQLFPYNNPASGKHYYLDNIRTRAGAFFVNKEGKRFVNEDEVRDVVAGRILEQTAQTSYEVFNQSVIDILADDPVAMEEVERWLEQGVMVRRDTIEACAEYFGVNRHEIRRTLDQYNQYVQEENDRGFGRTMDFEPMADGPFYMLEGVPSVHYTMGGVAINRNAQVLDTEGNVIPGLYAAGEVTGGIHGENRLGACAVPDALVFGRIAGGYDPMGENLDN